MSSGAGPVLCVVGARPNYMKMAPLLRAIKSRSDLPSAVLVHTGQHYDFELNDRLFIDLALPAPDVNLEVGSGSHAVQTAEVMKRFEPVIDQYRPSCVVVVGDVNSTLACSLVASKKRVPVVHVEAGLRSFDRSMPEEINRVLDRSDPGIAVHDGTQCAREPCARGDWRGRPRAFRRQSDDRFVAIGAAKGRLRASTCSVAEGLNAEWASEKPGYAAITLHRPSNVDDARNACRMLSRYWQRWRAHAGDLADSSTHTGEHREIRLDGSDEWIAGLLVCRRRVIWRWSGLMRDAALVLTDSGGIQEETTALGIPCLTMRPNTERPITVDEGTNTLVGADRSHILAVVDDVIRTGGKRGRIPEYWDGKSRPSHR